MGRYTSPYYMDPAWTQIGSNIAKIFVDPNPASSAQARLANIKADREKLALDATVGGAKRFRDLGGRSIDPSQVGSYISDYIQMGEDPSKIGRAFLVYNANTGQPDKVVAGSLVGTGKTIGENEGVSLADREAVAARADAARAQRSAIAAGPGYASVAESKRNHDMEQAWREKTRFDKPVTVNPGDVAFFGPDDTRFAGRKPGEVMVPKLQNVPAGASVIDPAKPSAGSVFTAPVPPGAGKPPMTVKQTDIDAIEWRVLGDLGGLSSDGKSIDPAFVQLHKDKLDGARAAMAEVYQQTRDAHKAAMAYLEALQAKTGDRFERGGGWYLGFGPEKSGPPRMERDGKPVDPSQAPAVVKPPAGGPPAGATYPPAPPQAQRQAGATYSTPRGPMKWTGTGWVPAGQ